MAIRSIAAIATLVFLAPAAYLAQQPTATPQLVPAPETPRRPVTSAFNQNWLDAVVSIELEDPQGKDPQPVGTGFLVRTAHDHLLLVTAKHVVERPGANAARLGYRLNTNQGASQMLWDRDVVARGLGNWFMSATDLACRFIGFSADGKFRTITTADFLDDTSDLSAASPLLVLGFPLGLRSTGYTRPIARQGIVARADPDLILADAFVFPGNSGGPVIYLPPFKAGRGIQSPYLNEEKLVGIVSSYVPYREEAISLQTRRPRIVFEENTGLANIIPVRELRKVMESEPVRKLDTTIK